MLDPAERKRRRNARDRRLLARKQKALDAMREQVTVLEHQVQLEVYQPTKLISQFLDATNRVQDLRHEQQALSAAVTRCEFVKDSISLALQDVASILTPAEPVVFSLTDEQAIALAARLCEKFESTLPTRRETLIRAIAAMPADAQHAVCGWRNVFGTTPGGNGRTEYAVHKTLRVSHETAESLCSKTWKILTDAESARRMCRTFCDSPPSFHCISEDVALGFCQWQQDTEQQRECLAPLSTSFLMARTNNRRTILVGNYQVVPVLAGNLADLFKHFTYWVFEDAPDGVHVTCGGAVTGLPASVVNMVVAEIVFNVVRWEALALDVRLLPYSTDTTNSMLADPVTA